jgi:CheY-like chemotaxis protein
MSSATATSIPHVGLSDCRVLLAKDMPDNQMLIKNILSASGAHVTLVNNGQEAVEKALQEKFNVILMDIQMPVLDDYEATLKLRQSGC